MAKRLKQWQSKQDANSADVAANQVNNCLGKDIQDVIKDVAYANKKLVNPNMFYARNLVLYNMQLPHDVDRVGERGIKDEKHMENDIEPIDSFSNLTK